MNNEVKNVSRNPESCELELTLDVTNEIVVPISPETLADAFWHMDEEQQCGFLNRLGFIADMLPFQLQSVVDCGQLDFNGRRVMQLFGDYSQADAMLAQRAKGE